MHILDLSSALPQEVLTSALDDDITELKTELTSCCGVTVEEVAAAEEEPVQTNSKL